MLKLGSELEGICIFSESVSGTAKVIVSAVGRCAPSPWNAILTDVCHTHPLPTPAKHALVYGYSADYTVSG